MPLPFFFLTPGSAATMSSPDPRRQTMEQRSAMIPDALLRESLVSPAATAALLTTWLDRLLPPAEASPAPLHTAMRYAVFSGGKRLRPQFLLQVAQACGIRSPHLDLAARAACAVELCHIASLVHDDLPCFDDADERRGRPTVHVVFGEPLAVLVGDALFAHGFEILSDVPQSIAPRAIRLVRLLVRATGSCSGLIGSQSLEQEGIAELESVASWSPPEMLERYHGMKTGALFAMAAEAAAIAAGAMHAPAWAAVGRLFGRWYQLAHDLFDGRAGAAVPGQETRPGVLSGGMARSEDSARAQLRAIHHQLCTRICELAETPDLMLDFLDGLQNQLLSATAVLPTEAEAVHSQHPVPVRQTPKACEGGS